MHGPCMPRPFGHGRHGVDEGWMLLLNLHSYDGFKYDADGDDQHDGGLPTYALLCTILG